ncbi:hypothetical protein [Thermaerobacillus caldiproteolyticus]|nr:hypothetical protein [Anoxybacillus caldiproteolyticus]
MKKHLLFDLLLLLTINKQLFVIPQSEVKGEIFLQKESITFLNNPVLFSASRASRTT